MQVRECERTENTGCLILEQRNHTAVQYIIPRVCLIIPKPDQSYTPCRWITQELGVHRAVFVFFFSCYYLGIFEVCVLYVRSGEHGSSQTETEYNLNWRNDLMRVKNNTLLFGTVMEKENYEKTVKMSFF